jgi:uncharacterized membrane protein
VSNAGEVRFVRAPDNVSTEVHVSVTYEAPGGDLGKSLATYFGENPSQHLDDDLRRFKQVMETGEVVRSEEKQPQTLRNQAVPAGNGIRSSGEIR